MIIVNLKYFKKNRISYGCDCLSASLGIILLGRIFNIVRFLKKTHYELKHQHNFLNDPYNIYKSNSIFMPKNNDL